LISSLIAVLFTFAFFDEGGRIDDLDAAKNAVMR
jgi:hypothetical protein